MTCDDPCLSHTILSDPTRSVEYTYDFVGTQPCDRYIAPGWYRFQYVTNKLMPQYAPEQYKCGTSGPIWLMGKYCVTDGRHF